MHPHATQAIILSNHHALPSSDQCSLQQHIVIVNFNRGPALMAFKHHCFLIQPAVTDCGKPACLPEELHGDHLFGKHWISGNLTAVTNWPSQGNVREKFCHRKFYVWATIQIMQALCHHLTADFAAYWVTEHFRGICTNIYSILVALTIIRAWRNCSLVRSPVKSQGNVGEFYRARRHFTIMHVQQSV